MEKKQNEMSWGSNGWVEKKKGETDLTGNNWTSKDHSVKGKEKAEKSDNPEALDIDDDDDLMESEEPPHQHEADQEIKENPDEIEIGLDDEDDETMAKSDQMEVDSSEKPTTSTQDAGQSSNPIPTPKPSTSALDSTSTLTQDATHFLALSKCLPNQEFLQFLDIPSPYDEYVSSVHSGASTSTSTSTSSSSTDFQGSKIPLPIQGQRRFPPLRYNSRWLAITRALHPFLCLERVQNPPLPPYGDSILEQKVKEQEAWIEENLMKKKGEIGEDAQIDHHPLAVGNVQGFVRTAPTPNEPGGNENGPREYLVDHLFRNEQV